MCSILKSLCTVLIQPLHTATKTMANRARMQRFPCIKLPYSFPPCLTGDFLLLIGHTLTCSFKNPVCRVFHLSGPNVLRYAENHGNKSCWFINAAATERGGGVTLKNRAGVRLEECERLTGCHIASISSTANTCLCLKGICYLVKDTCW